MSKNMIILPELKDVAICNGIGLKYSRQKIAFSDEEKQRLINTQKIFNLVLSNINLDFLPSNLRKITKKQLLNDLLFKKDINIVSVFCPSYKKGLNAIGYCEKIGSSTKNNINNLINLEKIINSVGCNTNITILFSDLLIENFQHLKDTKFRESLKENYLDLVDYCPDSFKVELLSSFGDLSDTIGENGAQISICDVKNEDLEIVETRDLIFYKNSLGWKENDSKQRTKDLSISYPYIARALNTLAKNTYLYWSESSYERYLLMPNLKLNIIFPKKMEIEKVAERDIIEEVFDQKTDAAIILLQKCVDKQQAVFEQGLNYFFDYISYGYKLLLIKTRCGNILPIVFNSHEIIISYPLIIDWSEMELLVKLWKSNFKEIHFKYLSEEQAKKSVYLKKFGFKKSIRSSNELFYSTESLTKLSGKDFGKLRHKRNKVLNSKIYSIAGINSKNIRDAEAVIDKWRLEKSHIYKKNRTSKEKNYLKNSINNRFEVIENYLLYINNSPVGVLSLSIRNTQNIICITILKGVNSTSVAASDYLYFFTFNLAKSKNIEIINDGDIGQEEGTKLHKLQFRPIAFRKVYDYVWQ